MSLPMNDMMRPSARALENRTGVPTTSLPATTLGAVAVADTATERVQRAAGGRGLERRVDRVATPEATVYRGRDRDLCARLS